MKASPILLRLLNVRKDEWWLVQKLFLLQFFQGAGIAFFFTSAFSRFLEYFQVSALANVFILTAFLLWIAGYAYHKLEHKLEPARLYHIITAALMGSMLLFWVGGTYLSGGWFYFIMLAWFNVLYLLNNLMFWGIAAQLYDVRQSKRLFGVISAGDIPAKFIGYSVAAVIVSYIGTINLLIPGLLFILISVPFLRNIIHRDQERMHNHSNEKHSPVIKSIARDYTVNTLIRRIALLSLIVSVCIVILNYAFYAEVKHAYKDDVELAGFIAGILAGARLIAMLIKIIFTSRIVYWLGNVAALTITPVVLIIMVLMLVYSGVFEPGTELILYIFGLAAIVIDVLRSAIDIPVLLTMMQPLTTPERLRAHNIVKGIMDPFAFLFSGVFLLLVYQFNLYSLPLLGYLLLALAVSWIIGILRVHSQYLKTLIKTISSRYFSQEEFNIYEGGTRTLIEEKIKTGSELEVMYILNMLGSRGGEEPTQLIIHALKHGSSRVINEALMLVEKMHIQKAERAIIDNLSNHPDGSIRAKAIEVLGKISFNDEAIIPYLSSDEKKVRISAIISILNHSHMREHRDSAEKIMDELFASGDPQKIIEASEVLTETVNDKFDTQLLTAINHPDKAIQLAAIRAMGFQASDACLQGLMKKIDEWEKPVLEAFVLAGDKSLPLLRSLIMAENTPLKKKERMINTIGHINGKQTHEILLGILHELPYFQKQIVKILHQSHFRASSNNQKFVESVIRDNLIKAAENLHMQKTLHPSIEKYEVILRSLQLELYELREVLLFLFSFLYDREKISKVKSAMELNKMGSNANAIELVDMTVKKEFANPFNAAFEHADIEHRCAMLKYLFPQERFAGLREVANDILADERFSHNNWTKACSLYFSSKLSYEVKQSLIEKYRASEDPLLKQTAENTMGVNH